MRAGRSKSSKQFQHSLTVVKGMDKNSIKWFPEGFERWLEKYGELNQQI